jgi:hypothetical protein
VHTNTDFQSQSFVAEGEPWSVPCTDEVVCARKGDKLVR